MDGVDPNNEAVSSSKIFISYRREDSAGYAGRLYDRLVQEFGEGRIFMDIDTIEPGEDFVEVIETAVASCAVLVVVIGKNWLTVAGSDGGRRLDDPSDFVRLEIAAALERKIRVIPLLIEGVTMPRAEQLPAPLQKVARLNACQISSGRWRHDVEKLIQAIKKAILKQQQELRAQAEQSKQISAPGLVSGEVAAVPSVSTEAPRGEEQQQDIALPPATISAPPSGIGADAAGHKRQLLTRGLGVGLVLAVVTVGVLVFVFKRDQPATPGGSKLATDAANVSTPLPSSAQQPTPNNLPPPAPATDNKPASEQPTQSPVGNTSVAKQPTVRSSPTPDMRRPVTTEAGTRGARDAIQRPVTGTQQAAPTSDVKKRIREVADNPSSNKAAPQATPTPDIKSRIRRVVTSPQDENRQP